MPALQIGEKMNVLDRERKSTERLIELSRLMADLPSEDGPAGCYNEVLCEHDCKALTVRMSNGVSQHEALQGISSLSLGEEERWCLRSDDCKCRHGLSYDDRLSSLAVMNDEPSRKIAKKLERRIMQEAAEANEAMCST